MFNRQIVSNPKAAIARGVAGRDHIRRYYSNQVVGAQIARELLRIQYKLANKATIRVPHRIDRSIHE